MSPTILVRYGELALKSPPVRREFERALGRNLLEQFERAQASCRVRADHGHLYVESEDADLAVRVIRRVFGVTSASPVTEVPSDRGEIERQLLEMAERALHPGSSFAVRARRTGNHPFTSQELARDLGAAVLDRFRDRALSVDLDHPSVELHVEVRGPRTYLYLGRVAGPGGLPVGVAGQVVALVDGERGALGAYLMMKRGCRCALASVGEGVRLCEEVLARFDPHARIEPVDGAPETGVARLAESTHADGVVLPISVEEFAAARTRWGDRVIFSPTVAWDSGEVSRRWRSAAELVA